MTNEQVKLHPLVSFEKYLFYNVLRCYNIRITKGIYKEVERSDKSKKR